ncbi:Fasciclin-like arabinogalactan protein 11 [Heracleum sosnowskyi]|uniref:Fasciclin-like arabinogalactan protein 11 n=1 Tax=Heracleum sosnowskyi TaxID=360622 RepID=A0AAD8N357_9APIA|nr:Fasciclin-like arabinogalactan protein 11 [Heracleum sosnowskyi]
MKTHFLRPFTLSLLILVLHSFTTTLAQPVAPPPAPSGPTNVTKILEKASQFTTLIRLLKNNQLDDQINTQLNNSNQGLTIFAPTDNAFAALKPGTLNSLTDQQKVQLIQFHVISSFLSTSQFQTVSNPITTQAGNSNEGQFPLNVTTSGNQVNVSTGVNGATVGNTIYTDNQLAVYQVDKVLLPLAMFGPHTPEKSSGKVADSPISDDHGGNVDDASGAYGLISKHEITIALGFVLVVACIRL